MSLLLAAALTWAAAAVPAHTRPAAPGWRLLWSDEFDGAALDLKKWSCELGHGENGWGNEELQAYTAKPDNIRVKDGRLIIRAARDAGGFTSARIKSQGKFDFRYGRAAARMKLPHGQGPWPAFWLLGADISAKGWPDCGEIDIMESGMAGASGAVSGAIHFTGEDGRHAYVSRKTRPATDGFHVYAVEWDERRVAWLLDGREYFSQPLSGPAMKAFHERFFILLNLAVGGPATPYTGNRPPDQTVFPQSLQVDWVRVYQKSQG